MLVVGASLIAKKRDDGEWSEKTGRQAGTTYDLLARFLREEFAIEHLRALRQHHLPGPAAAFPPKRATGLMA